jgi:hypothetical protein
MFFWGRLSQRWFLILGGAGFVILGLFLMTAGIIQGVREQRFAATGKLGNGRVVAKSIEHVRRGNTENTIFVVAYQFTTAAGEPVNGREVLPRRAWEAVHEGDAISVRYLPDNPKTNREASKGGFGSVIVSSLAGLLLGGLGARMMGFVVRPTWRRWRLKRAGGSAEGVVVAVEPSKLRVRFTRQWSIRYRFRDASGEEHERISGPLPPELVAGRHPGNVGTVFYDPNRPADSIWKGE